MKKIIKYIVVVLIFVSCSETVHDYHWYWGIEKCKDKGGLRYIRIGHTIRCKCNNGEHF